RRTSPRDAAPSTSQSRRVERSSGGPPQGHIQTPDPSQAIVGLADREACQVDQPQVAPQSSPNCTTGFRGKKVTPQIDALIRQIEEKVPRYSSVEAAAEDVLNTVKVFGVKADENLLSDLKAAVEAVHARLGPIEVLRRNS